jgi:hypothetical protein
MSTVVLYDTTSCALVGICQYAEVLCLPPASILSKILVTFYQTV